MGTVRARLSARTSRQSLEQGYLTAKPASMNAICPNRRGARLVPYTQTAGQELSFLLDGFAFRRSLAGHILYNRMLLRDFSDGVTNGRKNYPACGRLLTVVPGHRAARGVGG